MESVKTPGADSQTLRANKLTLVERLADDLAHEIKNPLHSMVINLEVLKRRVARAPEGDSSELLRYVGILSSELDRVTQRVELLLRMVRPDRGGEPTSLADAVQDLLEVVELERERQGISIELHSPERPSPVRIPRDSARQIILNLLLLAFEGSTPGGRVIVSSEVDDDGESLRLLSLPGSVDRTSLPGVEDQGMMGASVRVLVESFGGRLEIGHAAAEPLAPLEIVVALPATAS